MTMRAQDPARAARPSFTLPRGRRARAGAVDKALKRHESGAAVLMALFVATLATLIVSGLFWNQFVLLRTIENQQLVSQSRLLLRGALDWARGILREDQRTSPVTTLTQPWAQGLAETRLDQLGETSALASRATMSGAIEDAQSRFNLRNLVTNEFMIDEVERNALKKLCSLLGLPEAIADLVADRMRRALTPPPSTDGSPGGAPAASGEDAAKRPIPLVLSEDLLGVTGIDPAHAAKLAPYVVILDARTPVNLNTAREEVIAALFPRMTLTDAKRLVSERDRTYFVNTGDTRIASYRQAGDGLPTDQQIATVSRYFFVRGQVKLERASTRMEALVRRGNDASLPVRTLWQREL